MRLPIASALLFAAVALPAQTTAALVVRAPDGHNVTLSAATVAALPRVAGTATAHENRFTYSGADLRDVLSAAGVTPVDSLRGAHLRRIVLFIGSDGYAAAIALADLDPSIGGRRAILVDQEDGKPLPPDRGPYRAIVVGDARPSRWVRQVIRLEVMDVAPDPGAR
jgi:hypothetical protein